MTDYVKLLTTQQGLKAVNRWLLQRGTLPKLKWPREAAQRPSTHTQMEGIGAVGWTAGHTT